MAPVVLVDLDNTLRQACVDLAKQWFDAPDAVDNDMSSFTTGQRIMFLDELTQLQADKPDHLTADVLAAMDDKYKFATGKNAELKFRWYRICLRAGLAATIPGVVEFLRAVGRMKFVRPLFRELLAFGGEGADAATKLFAEHGPSYHPICQKMVSADIAKATAK